MKPLSVLRVDSVNDHVQFSKASRLFFNLTGKEGFLPETFKKIFALTTSDRARKGMLVHIFISGDEEAA
ncbi:hypothetical protein WI82_05635 [Burkholderia ubonensis]|nr:hypothetical protein WI82_05635 [Burkholderia ubonensis]KVT38408.1 hypothetical protein WK51_15105 [Burkholderia ubonensis]